jgi:hypothetical protein
MPRRRCNMCNDLLPPRGFYIVRMDIFAEPSTESITSYELEEMDLEKTIDQLIEQMKGMSADELQDQVHRRFELVICHDCQRNLLAGLRVRREDRQ